MNSLKTTSYTTPEYFTVTPEEVNNNNALLTNVLYNRMTDYIETLASYLPTDFKEHPKLYRLKVLQNAYLGETMKISSYLETLIEEELTVTVLVQNKYSKNKNTICKAYFKIPVKKSIQQAS